MAPPPSPRKASFNDATSVPVRFPSHGTRKMYRTPAHRLAPDLLKPSLQLQGLETSTSSSGAPPAPMVWGEAPPKPDPSLSPHPHPHPHPHPPTTAWGESPRPATTVRATEGDYYMRTHMSFLMHEAAERAWSTLVASPCQGSMPAPSLQRTRTPPPRHREAPVTRSPRPPKPPKPPYAFESPSAPKSARLLRLPPTRATPLLGSIASSPSHSLGRTFSQAPQPSHNVMRDSATL